MNEILSIQISRLIKTSMDYEWDLSNKGDEGKGMINYDEIFEGSTKNAPKGNQ